MIGVEEARDVRGRSAIDRPVVMFTNSTMVGGMEAHIVALAGGLVERGVEVAVICPDGQAIAPFREQLGGEGIHLHAIPENRRGPTGLASRLHGLVRVLRGYRGHLFHLHNTGSDGGTLPMLAAKLAGAGALIRTEHQPPDHPVSLRQRLLIRARDRGLARIVCVSRANMKEHVRDLGRDARKFTVVPNCVDLKLFDPCRGVSGRDAVRRLAGARDDELLIGMLGRLAEPRKGAEYFVDMARRMGASRDDMKFAVVGDGPRRAQLEERAAGVVAFLGRQPDAPACYAAMDIVVVPSLWEGGPITVLEAMAMGRPTVATDVGMVREVIVDGENGRIVPPGDVDALVDAVGMLASDAGLRQQMGERARRAVEAGYAPDVMVERMLNVYRGCVSQR